LIDAKYYQELSSKWAAQTKQKPKPGGNYYYNQKAYLGERFINLVYAKYYQNRITANAVAEYLPKFRGHLT
jgi:hypothetical protein